MSTPARADFQRQRAGSKSLINILLILVSVPRLQGGGHVQIFNFLCGLKSSSSLQLLKYKYFSIFLGCRGGWDGFVMLSGLCHAGVGVGHVGLGCGGSYRGWGGVWTISLNNLICHKLGILSFLLTNYCQLLSG